MATTLPADVLAQLKDIAADAGIDLEAVSQAEPEQNSAEAVAEANGLKFTRGRVYLNESIVQAAARVLSTGTPEVAQTDGGRSTHVILFRTEQGSVAAQNAYRA